MKRQGFEPDVAVSSSDVEQGRPAPWMAITAAQKMGIDTPEAIVKIGDTEVDIAEGLNAGMWSVGVIKTGNILGLTLEEQWALPDWELGLRLEKARKKMLEAGAHYVIDSIADAPFTVELINASLAAGRKTGSWKTNPYWISLSHNLKQKTGHFFIKK
jgi:phosphonoacetaldehyde hydrolase